MRQIRKRTRPSQEQKKQPKIQSKAYELHLGGHPLGSFSFIGERLKKYANDW
jgi:hypothetical protein